MKKSIILLGIFILSCGPTEAEIQERIDLAVESALNNAEVEFEQELFIATSTTSTSTTSTLPPSTTTSTTTTSTTTTSTTTTSTTTTSTTTTSTTTTTLPSCENYPPSISSITKNSGDSYGTGDVLSLTIEFLNGSRETSFIWIYIVNNYGDNYVLYNWGENDILVQSGVIEPRHTEYKIGQGTKTLEYTFDSYISSGNYRISQITVGDNEYSGGIRATYSFDESGKLSQIYYKNFTTDGCRYASNELNDVSGLAFTKN